MSAINEVEFCADVKSWIDAICLRKGAQFYFKGAGIEKRGKGRRERRDIVLYDRRDKIVLTGEVKLPDRPDGRNPYSEELVLDAHSKANQIGAPYFFTWNVNRMVIWQTFEEGKPISERDLDYFDWFTVRNADDLTRPEYETRVQERLGEFLDYCAALLRGDRKLPRHPLDKRFIHYLESALEGPSGLTRTVICRRVEKEKVFERLLGKWVNSNLGDQLAANPDRDDLLDRAARFSCYILANKIVFYDALRRKHHRLSALRVPQSCSSTTELKKLLDSAFRRAEEVSGDYETVFEGDDFGDSLPLLTDEVVPEWREMIKRVDEYDFASIDYDIIGHIFNRLLSPVERHKYGQHYTKSEIVDIINAFCIRRPEDRVIDPACGGGTFLVRAYARKKWLEDKLKKPRTHEDRIAEIYGVDITSYATHLAAVSLATRDLGRGANYPRIACADFFDINDRAKKFPARVSTKSGRTVVEHDALSTVDAVVGNPPYVRQELLPPEQKEKYARTFKKAWPALKISGRSDLHIYFWPHATSFFPANSGYFGFVTSASWLDVEYGFALQKWLLEHFCIEAVIESSVEPWFTDARVSNVVTIIRREPDLATRMNNPVRFVQVRRPLEDILLDVQHGDDQIGAAETIRARILETKKNTESKDWRIRVVRQRDLIAGPEKDNPSHHAGGKWGIHLRAPDVYFELMDRFGDKFVPLSELAEVRFGVKSGCDAFFFPRDITDEVVQKLTDAEFKKRYGITKKDTKKIRVCEAGDRSVHLIEQQFLEPLITSVMELDSPTVDEALLHHRILLVDKPKSAMRGTHAGKYIHYGETHPMGSREESPVHKKETVAARVRPDRYWYDLTDGPRPALCWPKAHQYKHVVSSNPERLVLNCRLYAVDPKHGVSESVLHGVLLSTVTVLMKFLYGRVTGREGNLDTMVSDTEAMPVPDLRKLEDEDIELVSRALQEQSKTKIDTLPNEFASGVRRGLDSAVLSALGVESEIERNRILNALYEAIGNQLAETRKVELIAQKNRAKTAKGGESGPETATNVIWEIPDETPDPED